MSTGRGEKGRILAIAVNSQGFYFNEIMNDDHDMLLLLLRSASNDGRGGRSEASHEQYFNLKFWRNDEMKVGLKKR